MARLSRPPVIAVMGHIDHGKSSLLDYIRKTNVVADEAGGITQHVSAYIAEHNERTITFLDTPGHEAFKTLRKRGAAAADIAILVVAADEGVMPQTLDALDAIKEASIPFIVAITKIDKNNADIERAKMSLLEHKVFLEGLGGDIPYATISSKTGAGVSELLDLVLLAADLSELSADPSKKATGFVLESTQDQKRGASATLIIKDGTLFMRGFVVAGDAFAPIRFIEDFRGGRIEYANPSAPVQISGFNKLPIAGTLFSVIESKKEAGKTARANAVVIATTMRDATPSGTVELLLIVKADTAGSAEAVSHELTKLVQEHIVLHVINSGVGNVTENDIKSAISSGAVIIAFNVLTEGAAADLAQRDSIIIESSSIIYELVEKLQILAAARTPIMSIENESGRAKILRTFSSSAKKQVLGVRLISGAFSLKNQVKIMRGSEEVGRGRIANLQQAHADVQEVRTEGDFGLEIEARVDAIPSDELIAFIITES